jgi:hypothetical protein
MSDQWDQFKALSVDSGVSVPEHQESVADEDPNQPPTLPKVEIVPVVSKVAAAFGGVLCNNGVFTRQRATFTIDRHGRLLEMSPQRLRSYCEDHLVTYKSKAIGRDVYIDDPQSIGVELARAILESDQFLRRQREVERTATIRQPVKRADGKIELLPWGYDSESSTFTVKSGIDYPLDVPLAEAREIWRDILSEFPLNDRKPNGQSRNEAALLALALSFYAPALLSLTSRRLNAMISSNSVGSGKTLLGQMMIIPVYGNCDVQPVPESDENFRKILDTEALAGSSYVFFDDIEGFFKNRILNSFLTAPTWSGRRMHSLSRFTVPKISQVILTGNNLEVSQDVTRRFLHVKMIVDESNPQDRNINRVIDDAWLTRPANRRILLGALWAMVREWDGAGRPKAPTEIRGYEEWCRVYASIVAFAGFGDALEPLSAEESGNSELADMIALISGLLDDTEFLEETSAGWSVDWQQIVDKAVDVNAFTWALSGSKKDSHFVLDAKGCSKFGRALSAFGGKKFTLPSGKRVRWDVVGKKRGKNYSIALA